MYPWAKFQDNRINIENFDYYADGILYILEAKSLNAGRQVVSGFIFSVTLATVLMKLPKSLLTWKPFEEPQSPAEKSASPYVHL